MVDLLLPVAFAACPKLYIYAFRGASWNGSMTHHETPRCQPNGDGYPEAEGARREATHK